MIPPIELERRARQGSRVEPRAFDLALSRTIAALEREHQVAYHPGEIVPGDPSITKDVFEAGLRLLLELGIYIPELGTCARLCEEEVKEALVSAKSEVELGEGPDTKRLCLRRPASGEKPFVFGGYAGTPTPEELFRPSAVSYAQEPLVDAIDHGSLTGASGVSVARSAPSEVEATLLELRLLREAIEEAGRPGLHLLACESSTSAVPNATAMASGLLRKGDAQLIPVLNEMKVGYDQLLKAYSGRLYGVHNAALVDPIVGGFARGAAGSAICAVAEALASITVYGASYVLIHPYHIHLKATSARECMWVEAVLGLVGERLKVPLVGDVWPANGGGCAEMLYEIAANSIVASSCSLNLLGPAPANGEKPHGSGLEARFMAEVGAAAASLKPEDAAELAAGLLPLYEASLKNPNPGLPFSELYDAGRRAPAPWWFETYSRVKKELVELGLKLE